MTFYVPMISICIEPLCSMDFRIAVVEFLLMCERNGVKQTTWPMNTWKKRLFFHVIIWKPHFLSPVRSQQGNRYLNAESTANELKLNNIGIRWFTVHFRRRFQWSSLNSSENKFDSLPRHQWYWSIVPFHKRIWVICAGKTVNQL